MATTRRKSSGRKKASRKKTGGAAATARKKSTGRKKSTTRKGSSSTGRKKKTGSRKYSRKASENVGREMHEMKRGRLRSGRSGRKVKSRKQAIAIGLSEARRKGEKVPPNPND